MDTTKQILEKSGQWNGPNYNRIALFWTEILGIDINAQQVSLCLAQMHFSEMIDNPKAEDKPIEITSCIYAYEAFQLRHVKNKKAE